MHTPGRMTCRATQRLLLSHTSIARSPPVAAAAARAHGLLHRPCTTNYGARYGPRHLQWSPSISRRHYSTSDGEKMWPSPASGSGDSSGNDAEPRFTDAGSKTSRGGEPIDEAEFNEHHDEYLDKDDIPGLYPHHEEAEAASETVDVGEEGGQRAIDDTWFVDPAYEDKPPPRSAGADNEFVPLWIQRAKVNLEEGSSPLGGVLLGDNLPLVDKCMAQLEAGHARDVVDLDVRETCDWTNRMIIAESASTKHMHALADDLVRTVSERG
ncbi:hypothetical protein EV182_002326 [Spiromyces aspiralis]|uniref:Uncharacterized protein n=1 Tax=Spiromyces aspiralis TaxID=68401 RepID=A0ACC1HHR8_9FUNG|nr:hypothetical protein EV182_002326 [Spiromyces aspiralis]